MTIKNILSKLDTSENPVASVLHKGGNFKVLVLAFKKGMTLKEHKASLPSKLTVIDGQVIYKEGNRILDLKKFDETDIPFDVIHSVEAVEDSLCLLTQG